MIQNRTWDFELDALWQWTVGWSHWSWRKGKATVTTEMTRRSNLLYLEVYNTNVCLRLFQLKKKKSTVFPLINHGVSVALAVLDACWTMQYWKESAKLLFVKVISKDHFCCDITPHFFKFESNVWYIFVYNMKNDSWKLSRSPLCVSTSTGWYHFDSVWLSRDAEHWNVIHSVLIRSVQSMFLCRLIPIFFNYSSCFFSLLFNDIFGVPKVVICFIRFFS